MSDNTVQELLKTALRKCGAYATGETPDASDLADALIALRHLLRSWSSKGGTMIFVETIISHALNGSESYTIGSGGDINTARPVSIHKAYVQSGGIDYPVKIIGGDNYADIQLKDQGGTYPQLLWYNPGYSQGTIYIYPPGSGTLVMHAYAPLTDFSSLTTDVAFPGEYDNAIVWNLACEMSPEYGKDPTPYMLLKAEQYKNDVMSINTALSMQIAETDMMQLSTHFNIDGGE